MHCQGGVELFWFGYGRLVYILVWGGGCRWFCCRGGGPGGEALGRVVEQGGRFRETTLHSTPLMMLTSVNKLLYLEWMFAWMVGRR